MCKSLLFKYTFTYTFLIRFDTRNFGALSEEDFREGWRNHSRKDNNKHLTEKLLSLVGNSEDGGNVLL